MFVRDETLFTYHLETTAKLWRGVTDIELANFVEQITHHPGIADIGASRSGNILVMVTRVESESYDAAMATAAAGFKDGLHHLGFRTDDVLILTKLEKTPAKKLS